MVVTATSTSSRPAEAGLFRRGLRVIKLTLTGAKGPFAIGIGGALVYAAAIVASSLVLGWVTDEVLVPTLEAGDLEPALLWIGVGAVVGVGLLKAAGVVGRRLGAYIAMYRLQAGYRRRVTRRYLELPIAWHRRHPTGALLSNASSDVESAFFLAAPLPMAIGATALLAIAGVLLVLTDPALAAIGFSIGPLLGLANWWYQRRMRHAATVAQQARAEVADVAHESFDAALVVKTLGREHAETVRFRTTTEDLRDKMIRVGRLRAFFDPIIEALPNIGVLLVLLVGAIRVRDGALSAGDLVSFAYLFRLIALPMRVFGWMLGELPRAVVGWDRVRRVLGAPDDMRYGERGSDSARGDGGASSAFDEVGFHHPRSDTASLAGPDLPSAADTDDDEDTTRGIESVSFEIDAGKTVAVVGATGSGKSTVASLMARLYDPDTGRIVFDGRNLDELSRDQLAEEVALVFQEAFLFDDTVRENIALGLDVDDDEIRRAARLAQAHGFVSELERGYDTVVGERGGSLSGGQRQRIALARALVRRPRLLILDDATSAVDPAVEADILRALSDAELPSTVVVVAYRRGAIELADDIIFLDEGRVQARGTHEQLLATEPRYAALVTAYERDRQASSGAEAAADAGAPT